MCVPSPLFCWMVHDPLPVCWVIRIPSGQRLSQYGHPVLCFCEYHWFWPDHGHTYFRLVEKQTASCFVYWDGKLVSRFSPETSLVLWIFNELDSRFVFIFYFFLFLHSHPGADGDVDAAAHHITAMFSSCNSSADKPVYHHFTTATDTANIQDVLHMVIDQIIKENLAAVQLLWTSPEDGVHCIFNAIQHWHIHFYHCVYVGKCLYLISLFKLHFPQLILKYF